MSLTRANAEFMIVAELSGLLEAAGIPITYVGSNVHLNGPICKAIRYLGCPVGSVVLITDADVAQVTEAQTTEFIDLLVLFTMETLMGWLVDTDITVGPRSEKLSQLSNQVERKIKVLRDRMGSIYGYGLPAIVPSVITLSLADHADEYF